MDGGVDPCSGKNRENHHPGQVNVSLNIMQELDIIVPDNVNVCVGKVVGPNVNYQDCVTSYIIN